jgi:hypothetical protein
MRTMSGTSLALTLTGATVLATAATTTAYACDTRDLAPAVSELQATSPDLRTPLNPDVYRAFLDAKLDRVATYVAALRAKVAAIPAGTVLTGADRVAATAELAKTAYLTRPLDAIPDSGTYAPTAAERARLAAIEADVAAIASRLTALLANRPAAAAPTTTKVVMRTTSVQSRDLHVCDHDGWRWDGYHRDGWSSWWHH